MSFLNFQHSKIYQHKHFSKLSSYEEYNIQEFSAFSTRSNTPETPFRDSNGWDSGSDKEGSAEMYQSSKAFSNEHALEAYELQEMGTFEIDVCPKRKKFSTPEEKKMFVEEYRRKYKTELCKNWELRGTCKFGDKCCFAHGKHELKGKILTHMKYKTKPCKQYHQTGYCPYGQRCQYLHKEALVPNIFFNPNEGPYRENSYSYEMLHEINKLCGTDCGLELVLNQMPARPRLAVFEKMCPEFQSQNHFIFFLFPYQNEGLQLHIL